METPSFSELVEEPDADNSILLSSVRFTENGFYSWIDSQYTTCNPNHDYIVNGVSKAATLGLFVKLDGQDYWVSKDVVIDFRPATNGQKEAINYKETSAEDWKAECPGDA